MTFVDDRCVLVNLREKVAVEVRVSASVRIWQVDIGHAAPVSSSTLRRLASIQA